jgi:hypothetical protein
LRAFFAAESSAAAVFLMCHLRGRDVVNLITEATFDFESPLPNGRRTPARASA